MGHPISPDGKYALLPMSPDSQLHLVDLATGDSRPIGGDAPVERVVRWDSSGSAIFLSRPYESPARIYRLDVETGQRTIWRELSLHDRGAFTKIVMTPDGETYAGSYTRRLGQLFQVRGLR
jgi:hypothetical protein